MVAEHRDGIMQGTLVGQLDRPVRGRFTHTASSFVARWSTLQLVDLPLCLSLLNPVIY